MSFKLALAGGEFAKDSELALENSKLSLKSSITGAIILALSLAFFMIYVIYIYTIREVAVETPGNLQTPTEWPNQPLVDPTPPSNSRPPESEKDNAK
jgi:hypothetical protein